MIWALRIGTAHGCFSISHDRNACYCIRISSMDHSPKSHFGLQYSGGREGGRGLGWGIPPISKNLTPHPVLVHIFLTRASPPTWQWWYDIWEVTAEWGLQFLQKSGIWWKNWWHFCLFLDIRMKQFDNWSAGLCTNLS